MLRKITLIASAALLIAGFSSCQKVYESPHVASVALATQPSPEPVSAESGTLAVSIYATSDWTAAPGAEWLSIDKNCGGKGIEEIIISYEANTTGAKRQGSVTFSSSANSETYVFTQDR